MPAAVTVTTTSYTLAAGETLRHAESAILLRPGVSASPTITIAGSLLVATTGPGGSDWTSIAGVWSNDGGPYTTGVTIAEGGLVSVDTTSGNYRAVGLSAYGPQYIIQGALNVTANSSATGIEAGFTATGRQAALVTGAINVHSNAMGATGVYMSSGDDFTNLGLIDVSGAHASIGVKMYQWGSIFANGGTIRATDTSDTEESIAVDANTTFSAPFLNWGTLQGDYALRFNDYNSSDWFIAPTYFDNVGAMIGKVDLGRYAQSFRNAGVVRGDVTMGSGNDTFDGSLGVTVGMVSGGPGYDVLYGGAGFDYLHGNEGRDTLNGGFGDDWVVGGKDDDLLDGAAGDDLILGNLGDDWCDGGVGADVVRGGQGNDRILGQTGDDWLAGDRGEDTIYGGAGADIFHTFTEADLDRVMDFNAAEGDRVQLLPGATFTVAQVGADVVVEAGGGAQLVLVGVQLAALPNGWIFGY